MLEVRQIPAIDVSHLPTSAFGHKEPLWWGVMLAIAIESTAFALAWATYLYLRMQEATGRRGGGRRRICLSGP